MILKRYPRGFVIKHRHTLWWHAFLLDGKSSAVPIGTYKHHDGALEAAERAVARARRAL